MADEAESWMTPPPAPPRPEPLGQAQQVDDPVEHVRLDLGAGRAGLPQHALGAEAARHDVGQDRPAPTCWPGSRRGSPGAASGWCRARPPGRGRRARRRTARGARAARAAATSGRRPAPPSGTTGCCSIAGQVVGHPVDDLVAPAAQLVGGHVERGPGPGGEVGHAASVPPHASARAGRVCPLTPVRRGRDACRRPPVSCHARCPSPSSGRHAGVVHGDLGDPPAGPPRPEHHLEGPAEAPVDDAQVRQRIATGGAHRAEVGQRRAGGAAQPTGEVAVGAPRVRCEAPRVVGRRAPSTRSASPAATGATTAGNAAGSSDASASQNATIGASATARPAAHAAPKPRRGSSTTTAPAARRRRPSRRSSRCRRRSPDSPPGRGRAPTAERRPRRGRGTPRRPVGRLGARTRAATVGSRTLTGWETVPGSSAAAERRPYGRLRGPEHPPAAARAPARRPAARQAGDPRRGSGRPRRPHGRRGVGRRRRGRPCVGDVRRGG